MPEYSNFFANQKRKSNLNHKILQKELSIISIFHIQSKHKINFVNDRNFEEIIFMLTIFIEEQVKFEHILNVESILTKSVFSNKSYILNLIKQIYYYL